MTTTAGQTTFRARLHAHDTLLGTFVKGTDPATIEILGVAGFDFVVLDTEHAPFDRRDLDVAVLACRAAGVACVIRVRDDSAAEILNALDLGADGILVPHVLNGVHAAKVAARGRHTGSRGYSNSPRAARYGALAMWEHADRADKVTAIIAMVEDPSAVDDAAEIMAVPGIDGIFVGRGDLAIAFQDREPGTPKVVAAADRVIEAGTASGTPVLFLVADAHEAKAFRTRGVTAAIIASDQTLLRKAAASVVSEARNP